MVLILAYVQFKMCGMQQRDRASRISLLFHHAKLLFCWKLADTVGCVFGIQFYFFGQNEQVYRCSRYLILSRTMMEMGRLSGSYWAFTKARYEDVEWIEPDLKFVSVERRWKRVMLVRWLHFTSWLTDALPAHGYSDSSDSFSFPFPSHLTTFNNFTSSCDDGYG